MTRLGLDYGDDGMTVELPDTAIVLRSGSAHREPDPLADPVGATRDAIRAPLGMPPLDQLARPGDKITIAFPDRVKGGVQQTAHRRVAIPLILDELERAGVHSRDVTLVCAIGLHRKNSQDEFAALLGEQTLSRVDPDKIINHDAEDPDGIVDLGRSRHGDPVQVNRRLAEADLAIMLGHTAGNPYGGFSGGYKMPATGLTTWRSIRAHHSPGTMQRHDFVPASTHSHFRDQLTAIGRTMESALPKPFFTVDAVLDGQSRQLQVAAGAISDVEQATWPLARQRTEVALDGPPADVLIIGMPRNFHYGKGMGSNPILMMQAIGASITRAKPALRTDPVVIAASVCDGWFNEAEFPATVAVYDALQQVGSAQELTRFEDEYSTRADWIEAYRDRGAYHPFHAFSMAYMGGLAKINSSMIFIAGARDPDYAHGMGAVAIDSVEAALVAATGRVGGDPRILVVPELSKPAYHLVGPH
ncbi:MAG TPA: lactate racemase domain-containing protein [Microlunatus sp.]